MKVPIKSQKEIEAMAEAGKLLAEIMKQLWEKVGVGVKTSDIDNLALELCKKNKVRPAFLNYEDHDTGHKFPAVICACIDTEIVHGVPSKNKILKEGDLFTIDMGIEMGSWYSDMARTRIVGDAKSRESKKQNVVAAANSALKKATKMCRPGKHLKDISDAIYHTAEKFKCRPMLEFVGHGIGKELHEPPPVPGHWVAGAYENIELKKGMVFAIEAILTSGDEIEAEISKKDHWSAWPKDRAVTACAENTVAIGNPPRILTSL